METMEQREEQLSRVCEKYDDPGRWAAGVLCTTVIMIISRVEYRGLYKTYPPPQHFTHIFHEGKHTDIKSLLIFFILPTVQGRIT